MDDESIMFDCVCGYHGRTDTTHSCIGVLLNRIQELEGLLANHWHTPLGSAVHGKGAGIWFDHMGPYQK
jgi:hypothetical protein